MSAPKYLEEIARMLAAERAEPGSVTHVAVRHDDWCAIFRGGGCDCHPSVEVLRQN